MAKESAGLLLYRKTNEGLEFLLVHPGGPFWKNKDAGAWTIPKGEIQQGEEPLTAAIREFEEELGMQPKGTFLPLLPVRQKAGKLIRAWAFESDFDPTQLHSNTFSIEWPLRSGKMQEFPEVDRAEFFNLKAARLKINPAQFALLQELIELVGL
jgi:predicted NUDIX family NTP pyrophosphohydrolase